MFGYMNIFYLNKDPKIAAIQHNDKHCVKMILEYAQMLSTAHIECDGDKRANHLSMYKKAHLNHPSTVWTRENEAQYNWLYELFVALADEYSYRYEKKHSTDLLLRTALMIPPQKIIKNQPFKQPPQSMPDKYKSNLIINPNIYHTYIEHLLILFHKVILHFHILHTPL